MNLKIPKTMNYFIVLGLTLTIVVSVKSDAGSDPNISGTRIDAISGDFGVSDVYVGKTINKDTGKIVSFDETKLLPSAKVATGNYGLSAIATTGYVSSSRKR